VNRISAFTVATYVRLFFNTTQPISIISITDNYYGSTVTASKLEGNLISVLYFLFSSFYFIAAA
jgi:hypothetical protein